MGTIVNNLANFYYDFFDGEVFCMEKAQRFFNKCADIERRANYIQQIYQTILSSSIINETSKIVIKTRKSYAEIARYYNSLHEQEINATAATDKPYHSKTAALIKADVSYTNRKLKSILGNDLSDMEYMQKDYFSLVIYQPEMDGTLWSRADSALERLKVTLNGKLISKETFWLNIPIREFNKQLTHDEFEQLIELIKPYFNSQKAIAQLKLNTMKKESGYLNYILKANMDTLSKIDIARRELILTLANKDQVQRFKEGEMQNQQDDSYLQNNTHLYQYQNTLLQLREEAENDKQQRIKILGKIGVIYCQSCVSLPEENQNAVDTLVDQFEQLKQMDVDRQQKITQLEKEIQLLKDQEQERKQSEP